MGGDDDQVEGWLDATGKLHLSVAKDGFKRGMMIWVLPMRLGLEAFVHSVDIRGGFLSRFLHMRMHSFWIGRYEDMNDDTLTLLMLQI